MVALSIQLVSITPSRSVLYTKPTRGDGGPLLYSWYRLLHSDLLYTKPTRGDGGPFYTAGIHYSIPICFILNQQEEMVALSIQLVSITPSRSVIY